MVHKNFSSVIEVIKELKFSQTFKLTGGAAFLNGKDVSLFKEDKMFKINVLFDERDKHYFNDVIETEIEPYELIAASGREFYVPLKATLFTNFHPVGDTSEYYYDYELTGTISQILTVKDQNVFDNTYLRLLIPINSDRLFFRDFQRWKFTSDIKSNYNELIKVKIKEWEFHFFLFRFEDIYYWGVDCLQKLKFREFQELAFSILNSYGFLKGDLFLNEAFYISSNNEDYLNDINLSFFSIRDSLETGYGIYTTNASSVYVPYFRSKKLPIDDKFLREWIEKLPLFSVDLFSRLCDLLYSHESISRAVLIILEANNQALELKAASYCVAYEAICHTIKNEFGIDSPNVIDPGQWDKIVKPEFETLLSELGTAGKLNYTQMDILLKKLQNWNQPTNRDSLTAPFKQFGYNLSPVEYKCIDNRNKFLHGSLPIKSKNDDEIFSELYFISTTLHKLTYILMLKLIGFEGHIINYPKLHENITRKPLEEELLIKI